MRRSKNSHRLLEALAVLATVLAATGCRDAQGFRTASGDALQTGVQAIATGLIDGFFAVYQPETTAK